MLLIQDFCFLKVFFHLLVKSNKVEKALKTLVMRFILVEYHSSPIIDVFRNSIIILMTNNTEQDLLQSFH